MTVNRLDSKEDLDSTFRQDLEEVDLDSLDSSNYEPDGEDDPLDGN